MTTLPAMSRERCAEIVRCIQAGDYDHWRRDHLAAALLFAYGTDMFTGLRGAHTLIGELITALEKIRNEVGVDAELSDKIDRTKQRIAEGWA